MKNKENKTRNSFMAKTFMLVVFLSAMLNVSGQSSEQNTCPHEFSLWGQGGLSTLQYSPTKGERSLQFGYGFGLGYTYFFHKNFGIMLGGELAFYNAKFKLDELNDSYLTKDGDGENIEYKTNIKGYEESQRMMNVNIPVMFQYQTDGVHKFFAGLGFKLGIPVSVKYEVSEGGLITASGYYYDHHKQELFDQKDLGYGEFPIAGFEEDLDFDLSYMGIAEAGMKWRLSPYLSLYTGIYFEYGFNDIAKTHTEKFVAYNNVDPSKQIINSALNSQYSEVDVYTKTRNTESFVERVSPFGLGLKLRLAINTCGDGAKPKPEPKPKPVPPPPPPKEEVAPPPPPPPPAPAPAVAPEKSARERAREIIASRKNEDERPLVISKDQEMAEAKYGKIRKAITVELVYAKGSAVLSEAMQERMNNAIASIKNEYGNEQVQIICVGHTCDLGSVEFNVNLAQKRADGVRDYLKQKGGFVNVTAESEGPRNPIVPNTSEENRVKNRRVVLVVK